MRHATPIAALLPLAVLVPLALAAPACDDGGGEAAPEEEDTLEAEACEHISEGPFRNVTAAAAMADAPGASFEHTSVVVALPEVDGGRGGFVAFEADEAGDFVFFLSADVPFAIFDATDTERGIEASAPVDACAEVAVEHVAELEVGTWYLWFGPTDATEVSLVAEHAGEGHEH